MIEIRKVHEEEYEEPPVIVSKAPGKINLAGDHTEGSDGFVLAIAINRYTRVAVSLRSDNSVRFFSANLGERKKVSLSNMKYKREDRWANYLKGVIFAFQKLGCPVQGMNITILGNIPQGMSLGSSSSIEIAFALALRHLYDFTLSDLQLIESARQTESLFLNLFTGSSDPLISLLAKKDHALFIDTRNLDTEYIDLSGLKARLLVTDSRVPNVSDPDDVDFREDFNSCLSILKTRKSGTHLRDFTEADISSCIGQLSEESRRRCIHIVSENERVLDLKKAFSDLDNLLIGRILNHSHESLRDFFEVSCPELDWLVKRAQETDGFYGSRMTGKGFGGCTLSLVEPESLKEYDEFLEEYDRIFGFKAEYFLVEPVSGAEIEWKDL